ncbi:MAG: serine/threonine-protein kinase [Acidimicrobiales bacterium]
MKEVAAELGISRGRVSQLRRAKGIPEPIGEIAAGPIWDLDAVVQWNTSGLRRNSGRPTQERIVLAGKYLLDPEPLDSGGFADVYRASDMSEVDSASNPVVAIKILRDLTDTEVRRRFERELRLVRDCRHPNIVPILDAGEDDHGSFWYSMPLAKGSLADEADRYVGKDDEILHIMRQLLAGLAYVHKKGIFHRDIKPANVLRLQTDNWAISDFGLAREAERTTTALTSTMQGIGTFFYSAPEAWERARFAEAPADIFSVGKLLHHLVTGQLPINIDAVEGRFTPVVRRATRQRERERYSSAEEMLAAIETLAAAQEQWSSPEDRATDLSKRLAANEADDSALDDLLDLAFIGPGLEPDLLMTIPRMSRDALARLWERDPESYRALIGRYADPVAHTQWPFGFCDVIADFLDNAVEVANDEDVMRDSVYALLEMGSSHNRFHVQDVAIGILQRIRTPQLAMAAAEGIRRASVGATTWTISEAKCRSLHPIIRELVESLYKTER